MKHQSFALSVPIYKAEYIIVIGKTCEDCENAVQETWELNSPKDPFTQRLEEEVDGRFGSVTSDHPECRTLYYIAIPLKKHSARKLAMNISHESIHAAFNILEHVGVSVTADNHEALTYLSDFIQERVWECIDEFRSNK
jgi:hypothetical protein